MQADRLQVINQKQKKMVKQSSLRFGPFDFSEDMEWEEFLEKVAAACEVTCEGLVIQSSVGEVQSRTDWDPVWTRPNPAVPVQVWDFPENTGLLGLRSGHSHIARDCLRPGLDRDHINLKPI